MPMRKYKQNIVYIRHTCTCICCLDCQDDSAVVLTRYCFYVSDCAVLCPQGYYSLVVVTDNVITAGVGVITAEIFDIVEAMWSRPQSRAALGYLCSFCGRCFWTANALMALLVAPGAVVSGIVAQEAVVVILYLFLCLSYRSLSVLYSLCPHLTRLRYFIINRSGFQA